jgi:hypothetical protein
MHCSRVLLLVETVVATTKIRQNNSSILRTVHARIIISPIRHLDFEELSHSIPSHHNHPPTHYYTHTRFAHPYPAAHSTSIRQASLVTSTFRDSGTGQPETDFHPISS